MKGEVLECLRRAGLGLHLTAVACVHVTDEFCVFAVEELEHAQQLAAHAAQVSGGEGRVMRKCVVVRVVAM